MIERNKTPADSTGAQSLRGCKDCGGENSIRDAARIFLHEEAVQKVTPEMSRAALKEWERCVDAGVFDMGEVVANLYAAMKLQDPIHQLLPRYLDEDHLRIYMAGLEVGMEHGRRIQENLEKLGGGDDGQAQ